MKDLNGFPSGRMVWEVLCTTIFGNEKKGEVKTISFNLESLELTTRLKEIKKDQYTRCDIEQKPKILVNATEP